MSSERRILRPFMVSNALSSFFHQLEFRVGQDVYQPDVTARLSVAHFLQAPVAIHLAKSDEALKTLISNAEASLSEIGLDPADVSLIVVARTPFLKIVDVLVNEPLISLADAGLTRVLTKESRPRALLSPHGGAEIEAFLILNRQLERKVLIPWRKGTWLARTGIRLTTDLGSKGFIPRPLTDQVRELKNLPKGTVEYIELDESVLMADINEDALDLYVDDELLALISVQPKSTLAILIQHRLFMSAVDFIIAKALDENVQECSLDDIRGSLLERIMEFAIGGTATMDATDIDVQKNIFLKSLDTNRHYLRSYVEARLGTLNEMHKGFNID